MKAATRCHDCGVDAWMQSDGHEDFYVHDALWDAACPDDKVEQIPLHNGVVARKGRFVLCIGCFEERLGRRLTADDFKSGATPLFGTPPTSRFVDRAGAGTPGWWSVPQKQVQEQEQQVWPATQ